ncbi:MAG: hypothetical protein OJF51_004873 [Nitrospira sp.]|nr:MAG: hypothetical protein OJF51_004873 [Nitrospira sp.]
MDARTERGRGRIYQRGSIWWIQYFFNGQDRRESTHSSNRKVAEKLLTKRMAAKDAGTLQEVTLRRLRFEDLQASIEGEYQLNRRKSLDRVQDAFQALSRTFAGWLASAITEDRLTKYANSRIDEEKAAHATVRYELAVLKRAFRLAKVPCPPFPSIQVRNARTGFFERQDFEAVLTHLPAYLRPVMRVSYLTGWRTLSEVLPLQWRQIDLQAGLIRPDPGTTKNGEGRLFPFQSLPGLAEVIQSQWEAAQEIQRGRGVIVPWVFFRVTHKAIEPIKSYKTAWATACQTAGIPDRLVHDLRRTAARNLRRAGIPESVAMELLGHKTPEIFRRYDIKNEQDLTHAVEKLAAFHAHEAQLRDNHGTITPIRTGAGKP